MSVRAFTVLDANDLPRAWVLQAGSFEARDKAEGLMQQSAREWLSKPL